MIVAAATGRSPSLRVVDPCDSLPLVLLAAPGPAAAPTGCRGRRPGLGVTVIKFKLQPVLSKLYRSRILQRRSETSGIQNPEKLVTFRPGILDMSGYYSS
jgi:hypothetical protein